LHEDGQEDIERTVRGGACKDALGNRVEWMEAGPLASSVSLKRQSNDWGVSKSHAGGMRKAVARARTVLVEGSACSASLCSRCAAEIPALSDNDSTVCSLKILQAWIVCPICIGRGYRDDSPASTVDIENQEVREILIANLEVMYSFRNWKMKSDIR
jgi:hypothetical protein